MMTDIFVAMKETHDFHTLETERGPSQLFWPTSVETENKVAVIMSL